MQAEFEKARANKTPDWTEEEVKEVLKHDQ